MRILEDTLNEVIELGAGETRTVKYDVSPLNATVSYLVLEMRDGRSKSFTTFVLLGRVSETNVNFPSIMNYPLRVIKNGVFACIHSTDARHSW